MRVRCCSSTSASNVCSTRSGSRTFPCRAFLCAHSARMVSVRSAWRPGCTCQQTRRTRLRGSLLTTLADVPLCGGPSSSISSASASTSSRSLLSSGPCLPLSLNIVSTTSARPRERELLGGTISRLVLRDLDILGSGAAAATMGVSGFNELAWAQKETHDG